MKPIIIHGAWALLAAGAYIAGTLQRRVSTEGDSSSRNIAAGIAAAGKTAAGSAAKQGRPGPATLSTEANLLDSFRSKDGKISAERMKDAVAAAMQETDPVKSVLNFALLLNELTPENAPAILQAINENSGSRESGRFLSLLAHAWGSKDGNAALAAMEGLQRRDGENAKATAMAAWAANDPDAAMRWLNERNAAKDPNADPRQDSALARGLVVGLARRDADGALKYLMTLSKGQQSDYVGAIVEQKMKDGLAAGAEWAENLPTEQMRVTGMEIAGESYLRGDLDGAVKWAEKIASRPDAHEAVADVADALTRRNPQEAVAWVASLPPGPSQNHAFEDVFDEWTPRDPLAASQSLTNMPPGPGRDAAIEAFSSNISRENPTDALTWVGVISDPKRRTSLQVDIARRWFSNAPNEATPWIAANLPADLQTRAMTPRR
jgi:hypothetical protein